MRNSKESPKVQVTPCEEGCTLSEGLKEERDLLKMHFLPEENKQNPTVSATAP